jgi:two-component system, OmpR family, sensor histidine kinase KdpD
VNEIEQRPDPDRLLAQLRADEAKAQRGRLKIFFGGAAGVGKTYTMLEDGRKQRAAGRDAVVGYVEPHGRPETEALLAGLEQLPTRAVAYRGVALQEFDLDAALARRPQLMLVDELAHTNAPGSRHSKRWQDVDELLDAGIDVYSTLNVQHLESLNDIVAQITGVTVRETLPDAVFERADEVELIDLPPDDLLQRFREGKVYVPQQVERAMQGFFRKSNLIALRELALRRTADRVNAEVLSERERQPARAQSPWPTRARVLVCVGADARAGHVIRAGRRLATALRADWIAATVETPFTRRLQPGSRARLAEHLRLAERLGGETQTLSGQDVAEELLDYARSRNVTHVVVGAPSRPRWVRLLLGSATDDLMRAGGDVDLHVVHDFGEDEPEDAPRNASKGAPGAAPTGRSGASAGGAAQAGPSAEEPALPLAPALRQSALAVLASSALAGLMAWGGLGEANLIMAYLLGVAWVAARHGRGAAIAASFVSVLLFDFLFVSPNFSFAVSDTQYLVTFAVMLGIALLISALTVRIREQAEASRERERRTGALFRMSRHLSSTTGTVTLVHVALMELAQAFGKDVAILLPDGEGRLVPPPGAPASFLARDDVSGVARWAFDHGQSAGRGTDTLPGSEALYIPLVASHGVFGVLGIRPPEGLSLSAPEQRQLLETLANQIALALERDAFARTAQERLVAAEAERMRSSLLSSVSHDLRTPLSVISGASGALLEDGGIRDPAVRREMLQNIRDEAERLARLVRNLLDMTRLESGALAPAREWLPLEELVGSALHAMAGRLGARTVTTALAPDLPMLSVDGVLVEQLLINLLDNVVQHVPDGTPIEIRARAEARPDAAREVTRDAVARDVVLEVSDRGPGIPPGDLTRIFEKFQRASPARGGTGLGLAICRGIAEAHGGRIEAENRPGGGTTFRVRLPVVGEPPAVPPEAGEGVGAAGFAGASGAAALPAHEGLHRADGLP